MGNLSPYFPDKTGFHKAKGESCANRKNQFSKDLIKIKKDSINIRQQETAQCCFIIDSRLLNSADNKLNYSGREFTFTCRQPAALGDDLNFMDSRFTSTGNKITSAGNSFTLPGNKLTLPNSTFTYTEGTITSAGNKLTMAESTFTLTMDTFTCTLSTFTSPENEMTSKRDKFTLTMGTFTCAKNQFLGEKA